MSLKKMALLGSLALTGFTTPASALTIVLNDTGGVNAGSDAWVGFSKAAKYWESVLTNNATVNLDVGFRSLGAAGSNILGQAGSTWTTTTFRKWENAVFTNGTSSVDALVRQHLPALNANGAMAMITPGYNDTVNKLGVNARTRVYDNDGGFNNRVMGLTTANAKALGFTVADPNAADAAITFNSDFTFDFNPTDGTDSGAYDFLDVAIHEIGHALGFVSGVDGYDYFATPNGPGAAGDPNYDANNDWWGAPLDMFRYGANKENFAGGGPLLDWSIRNPTTDDPATYTNPYFSLDGGTTMFDNAMFSRGQFNGASFQASHWRSAAAQNPTMGYVGVMNPYGTSDATVTSADIAAFDAMGWNTTIDALASPKYSKTMAEIYNSTPVPEPATWIQLIMGFGVLGGALRASRRRTLVTTA